MVKRRQRQTADSSVEITNLGSFFSLTLIYLTEYQDRNSVSHRLGIAVGVQFSDTTLQGADQGSPSQPSSHTLCSSHQNESRREEGRIILILTTGEIQTYLDMETSYTFSRWSSVSTIVATRMSMGFLLSTASTFIPNWKPCGGR